MLINEPALVKDVMTDPTGIYPKNDLMVGALEPLVGDSIFVSSGEQWRRQRAMIDPAFSHMRLNRAFGSMTAAVDDYEDHLDRLAAEGITKGCNPPANDRFCPDDDVTRGQMAAFLHRALG